MSDRLSEAILVLVFALLAFIWAAPAVATVQILGSPVGSENITVSSASIGISECGVGERALIQIKSNSIYFNLLSETATSSHYLGNTNDYIVVPIASWFRAIRATGSDADLYVTCFK